MGELRSALRHLGLSADRCAAAVALRTYDRDANAQLDLEVEVTVVT